MECQTVKHSLYLLGGKAISAGKNGGSKAIGNDRHKPELIYIAGYGRSGSTLLERLLQYQPAIYGCGEMADFFSVYGRTSARCSCGQSLQSCEFWGAVARELSHHGFSVQDFSYFSRIQKKYEAHWTHGGSLFPAKYYSQYKEFMQPFFTAVSTLLGSEDKAIVDSSKTSYLRDNRPAAICKLGEYRVRVIHIVRDCRGVVWSMKKGLNRKLEAGDRKEVFMPAARAVAGWVHANRAASRLRKHLGTKNYCLLRYEDLVQDPVRTLESIARRFWGPRTLC